MPFLVGLETSWQIPHHRSKRTVLLRFLIRITGKNYQNTTLRDILLILIFIVENLITSLPLTFWNLGKEVRSLRNTTRHVFYFFKNEIIFFRNCERNAVNSNICNAVFFNLFSVVLLICLSTISGIFLKQKMDAKKEAIFRKLDKRNEDHQAVKVTYFWIIMVMFSLKLC